MCREFRVVRSRCYVRYFSRRLYISFSVCFNTDHLLRKAKAAYEFPGRKEKINHYLLFMDDLKLYSRNEKELDSLVQTIHIFSKDKGTELRN